MAISGKAVDAKKESKKELTHQRILATAAKIIRRDGFEALAVADVMKQAGLTHGGFYAHFANRDALLAEALAYAGTDSQGAMENGLALQCLSTTAANQPASELQTFIELYLSEQHLFAAQSGVGCPVAALGGEFHRLDEHSQTVAAKVVTALVERLVQLGEGNISKQQAFLCSSAMVGVIQLARALDRSEALVYLDSSRQLLLEQFLTPAVMNSSIEFLNKTP
ncbi:TetR/AcrR family transcriptional regulator [Rheinheimera riviphila]|uniref:TetR/AcrR family transcriptional regulator n=1 Tax=Rheinheimera riviphila TaxID=1834037 RepID=A0A437QG89_9GAMM|nr:TetR/AcrR family transcriptional regulator [Rheinheimera riviphila]RVU33522.1 TetR/AcrR family transcriptional regulator [Rheinheimera riviphila]